jgi:hypothetical protein
MQTDVGEAGERNQEERNQSWGDGALARAWGMPGYIAVVPRMGAAEGYGGARREGTLSLEHDCD